MDRHAIFLDFDGTLSFGENKVSKENTDAIKKAQEFGHYVFISTGRSRTGIEDIASAIHSFDGYISGLGSHITMNGDVIYGKYFDTDSVIKIINALADTGIDMVIGCVEGTYVINPNELQQKYFHTVTPDEFIKDCKNYRIQKIESRNTNWTKEQLALLNSASTAYVHDSYTECCPIGCSKSAAIKIVADKLRIKPENTIAMGDSANDLDMLLSAGIGVVMGNAPDFVKEKADFISTSCKDHGVAYAIKKLILDKKA